MTTTSLSSSNNNNNKNNFHINPVVPRIVSKKNHRHLTQQQQQHHDDRIRIRLLHKLGVKNDEKIKNIQVQETSRGSLLGDIIVTHEPLKFDSKIPNTKNVKNSGRNNKKQNNKNKNYNKNSNDNKSSLNLWDFILSWSSVSSSKPSTMPSPDYEHANDYSTTTENTSLLYSSSSSSSSSEGIVKSCDNDATTTTTNDDSTTITTKTIQQQQPPPPPQRKRLSFHEQVDVVLIPTRNEYSKRIRDKLWSSPQDMLIQAQRNSIEFAAEGWDWRNTMEDEHMYRCLETNELIHPIHIELQRQHDEQDEKQEIQDN